MTDYPTGVRISEEVREALKRLAAADGRSLASYMARVLEKHVERELAKLDKPRK
jgi:predicted DNA-binding protein